MRFIIFIGFLTACGYSYIQFGGMEKLNRYFAEKQNAEYIATGKALINEREQAFLASYKPGYGCENPGTEIKRLECRNRASMAKRGFIAEWNRKNAFRFPKPPN